VCVRDLGLNIVECALRPKAEIRYYKPASTST
jgi:hypothetical protein